MNEGGIPIVFIRFNPDCYRIDGKKQNLSQTAREEQLFKWVQHYFDNPPPTPLGIRYLFYNNKTDKYYELDPYTISPYRCKCEEEFYIKEMYNDHIINCAVPEKIDNDII